MQRILVLYAHPAARHSVVNKSMAMAAGRLDGVTFVDLYREYPRMKIDVDREQERLLAHDVVVMQFPLMWYSTPSILKEWQDLVLEHGFAYGQGATFLHGKLLVPVVSAGGPESAYKEDGYNNFDLRVLLTPLEQTANLCKLRFVSPYVLFGSMSLGGNERLRIHVDGYVDFLTALRDETLDIDAATALRTLSAEHLPRLREASQ